MPSISLFFRFLDVRGSRGALRPCLGGPSAFPKHILGSRAKHILQLVFAEIFFSGVPQRTSRMKLLLPPPLTPWRPHCAGLEPAGPKAWPDREAIQSHQGRDPPRGPLLSPEIEPGLG